MKRWVRSHTPLIGSVTGVRSADAGVVLTYDDGPDPAGTTAVLAALGRHGATATFFVLNTRARAHPDLLAEIVAAGNELGLHGPDHRALTELPGSEVYRRTLDARNELEDLSGVAIRWFRPPYGRQTLKTFRAVRRAGLDPVVWTTTALDGGEATIDQRVANAVRDIGPGEILLAHDGRADARDGVDDGTIAGFDRGALADAILTEYETRGLSGMSLEHALRHGPLKRGYWFAR